MSSLPLLTTNEVELTSRCSPSLSATFNRGLISTQHTAKALKENFNLDRFKKMIGTQGNQLRKDLTGQLAGTVTGFLKRAQNSGHIYAALYELTDVELVKSLVALGTKLDIVLADVVTKEKTVDAAATETPNKRKGAPVEENKGAWKSISASTPKGSLYRLPPSSHIVHNKLLIYVDGRKRAQAVLTGSTNWTATGLCAQTNNALVIEDPLVARRYLDYWNALKADQEAHEQNKKSFQAPALRSFNSAGKRFTLDKTVPKDDATTPSALTSYFSPDTPKQRPKKRTGEEEPVDMNDLSGRVNAAKHAVLFLAFIPGTPSITDFAAAAQRANKDLFVRGCVTSPDAAGEFYYSLRGSSPPKKTRAVKGQPKPPKVPIKQDPRVIAAQALDKADAPKGWVAELLKAGFAITHDKIVVIDPFSDDDCVVITGSHNLGYQASYNNDENLVMIRGNKKLATAYATHVLDVYDHFAWRWTLKKGKRSDDSYVKSDSSYLQSTADEWLNRYFDNKGNIKTAQLKFWMQATV
ncbi:MAG: phospholipase D-like domain-containing protein [Bryobacteraceae bacterium]|jgi:phosphatidylserine/phosphatidylglycerophosphate/cardiolipin synthase-like enzyme